MEKIIKIVVLGLGYIGLPSAAMFATKGYQVLGVDIKADVVETINKGEIHIHEPGLATVVEAAVRSGNLRCALKVERGDVFIIAVPTPCKESKKADLSFVEKAAKAISEVLKDDNLVILESTSPPGTTKELIFKILNRTGRKFNLAYAPERVLPGKILKELIENDRIIGGIDKVSASKAKELYRSFVEGEIYLTDATSAEMVKLVENTFRDINIAFANELMRICDKLNINVWEIIKLANKHPRVNVHKPGPGVGGHCIAVDPWFIVEKCPREADLVKTARNVNDSQPDYVTKKVKGALGVGGKILVMGVTYKGDVDDTRESPALKIVEILRNDNYELKIYDPFVEKYKFDRDEKIKWADLVIVLVGHSEFASLGDVLKNKKAILDFANILGCS